MKQTVEVKRFVFNPFMENTYVLYDGQGACVIIDPGCNTPEEEEEIRSFIEEKDLHPEQVLLTHAHLDHVCGTSFFYETYGLSPLLHPADRKIYDEVPAQAEIFSFPVKALPAPALLPDEQVTFGDTSLQVIHIPGHSPGGVAFFHAETRLLFSGDILFNGSIGRTDLPGGDYDLLVSSIAEKLIARLDPDTLVFPGHGPETSLEHEARTNPFLDFLGR
jgi:glyoxylase-like metal-dependent hydrolase (beta-lactamase superfamily II)